jgi:hypothetical protein
MSLNSIYVGDRRGRKKIFVKLKRGDHFEMKAEGIDATENLVEKGERCQKDVMLDKQSFDCIGI